MSKKPTTITKDISYYCTALKLPAIDRHYMDLAQAARDTGVSFEEFLEMVLAKQMSTREINSTRNKINRAHFPVMKTLEDFNFEHAIFVPRELISSLATGLFIEQKQNVIMIGPPGVGKTHLATALGIKAAYLNQSVIFDTAAGWITRLQIAFDTGKLEQELTALSKIKLLIIDELGYLPLTSQAANLLFQLVSRRYEKGSITITSNLPFSRWGETFARRQP